MPPLSRSTVIGRLLCSSTASQTFVQGTGAAHNDVSTAPPSVPAARLARATSHWDHAASDGRRRGLPGLCSVPAAAGRLGVDAGVSVEAGAGVSVGEGSSVSLGVAVSAGVGVSVGPVGPVLCPTVCQLGERVGCRRCRSTRRRRRGWCRQQQADEQEANT